MKIKIDILWPVELANASQVRLAFKLLEVNQLEFTVYEETNVGPFIEVNDEQVRIGRIPEDWYQKIEDPFGAFWENFDVRSLHSTGVCNNAVARLIWTKAREDLKEAMQLKIGKFSRWWPFADGDVSGDCKSAARQAWRELLMLADLWVPGLGQDE